MRRLCGVAPMLVELLCLPSDDVAESIPNVSAELGVGRSSSFRCPLGRCLDGHAVSIGELPAGDPPAVGSLLHGDFFPSLPLRGRLLGRNANRAARRSSGLLLRCWRAAIRPCMPRYRAAAGRVRDLPPKLLLQCVVHHLLRFGLMRQSIVFVLTDAGRGPT